MHRRVVAGVSLVLFAVLALAAAVVTDLLDRSSPRALGATASVALDFSQASMSDAEAFAALGRQSDELALGLVKVAPDLGGDRAGQVFVALGTPGDLPPTVPRFGAQPDARVEPSTALEHSFASGDYLVTGRHADRAAFAAWLGAHQVGARWADDGVRGAVLLVVRQTSFAAALVAAAALAVALALFWLTVRARGRALRVLAGVPVARIQVEDLGGFLLALLAGAVTCDALAAAVIGVGQGWVFVPSYVQVLAVLGAIVVGLTLLAALVLSAASWPSGEALAARRPAAARLRGPSGALQAGVFVLLVASVGPAASDHAQANEAADQQAAWYSLSDEVALAFPAALGEDGFERVMPAVGELVSSAEAAGAVALSTTWSSDASAGLDLGSETHLAMVNPAWLTLVLGDEAASRMTGFAPLRLDQVPVGVRGFLEPSMRLWARDDRPGADALAPLTFYRYTGREPLPVVMAGGGGLRFLDTAVVAVAPHVHDVFDDSFLSSMASSQNLVLAGLAPTLALVHANGLTGTVGVRHVAEDGVLRAQYTAYFAWLRGAGLVALGIALALSAAVGAVVTAVVRSRRDFLLRLAGASWAEILAGRVWVEWLAGLAITGVVLLGQGGAWAAVVAVTAVVALLVSPLSHRAAARWTFALRTARRS